MFFAVANLLASSLGHKAESAKNRQLRQGAAMRRRRASDFVQMDRCLVNLSCFSLDFWDAV
jgi:hypothetical protein